MNKVTLFDFNEQAVRVITGDDDQHWWVASDVCRVLELKNSRDAVAELDEDERQIAAADLFRSNVATGDVRIPNRGLNIISESGLYSLIFKSRKPEAKAFKRWVTKEVLPAIRKTGAYATPAVALGSEPDAGLVQRVQVHLFDVMARFMAGGMNTACLNAATNWAGRVYEGIDLRSRLSRARLPKLTAENAGKPAGDGDGSDFWLELLAILRGPDVRARNLRQCLLLRSVWLRDGEAMAASDTFDGALTGRIAAEILQRENVRLKVLLPSEMASHPGALRVLFMDHAGAFGAYRSHMLRNGGRGIEGIGELREICTVQPWFLPGSHNQKFGGATARCWAIALDCFPFADDFTALLSETKPSN